MDPISGLSVSPLPNAFSGMRPQPLPSPKIATQELADLGSIGMPQQAQAAPASSFADMLGKMVQEVNTKHAAASEAVSGVVTGENVPLHQAMIAIEEASVSFQLMVEVRNKLVESYQELMRMQI